MATRSIGDINGVHLIDAGDRYWLAVRADSEAHGMRRGDGGALTGIDSLAANDDGAEGYVRAMVEDYDDVEIEIGPSRTICGWSIAPVNPTPVPR